MILHFIYVAIIMFFICLIFIDLETTPRRSISFAQNIASSSTQENVNTSPSPTTPSLRRSSRRSSVHQISLAESPLDISFLNLEDSSQKLETPEKKSRRTPSKTLKNSVSKTPNKTPKTTPKKAASRTILSRALDLSVDDDYEPPKSLNETLDDMLETTPKKSRRTPATKTPSKTPNRTPKRSASTRISALEPVIGERKTPIRRDRSDVQLAKESLHVSAVPKTLPCREKEFTDAYNFIESKIVDETGG